MPATDLAIHALAERCRLERRNMLSPGFDLHGVGFPEAESVDRTSRPGTAGIAMTIAHCLRRAGDLKLNGAAKTASRVTHDSSPFVDDQFDQLSGIRKLQSSSRTVLHHYSRACELQPVTPFMC